jgi:hypothetical protein
MNSPDGRTDTPAKLLCFLVQSYLLEMMARKERTAGELPQSSRSAVIGSARDARIAGIMQDAKATIARRIDTPR